MVFCVCQEPRCWRDMQQAKLVLCVKLPKGGGHGNPQQHRRPRLPNWLIMATEKRFTRDTDTGAGDGTR